MEHDQVSRHGLRATISDRRSRYVECNRGSPYPILRHLAVDVQLAQKNDIQRALKPTVIRYMGIPHECVFRLQKELFPSARIIRCLYDPFSQDLSSVFGSTSTKVGETAFGLFQRMVPYDGPFYYDDPPRPKTGIKVIEYQKKGFESRDLNLLPDRQIQSSIRIKASGGIKVYREHWERYDKQADSLQYLVANRYLVRLVLSMRVTANLAFVQQKNIHVVDRPDLEEIVIKIYMKPTPGTAAASLITSGNGYGQGLKVIYDHIESIAKKHPCQELPSSIKFQLFFIHGDSPAPVVRRPDYSRYEKREQRRSQSRDRDSDDSEDEEDYDSEDYDDHSDDEDEGDQADEQQPVYMLEFTRHDGKVRATQSSVDKDVLGCSINRVCSRCRSGAAA